MYEISVFFYKVGRLPNLMGVNKDVYHPTDCLTKWESILQPFPQDGPVWPEALHNCGLCNICSLAGCLSGHRRVPRPDGWAPTDYTGILDGRQEHGVSSCVAVPHRLIPVCCGHHRCTSGNLHSWDSVLVHWMCLHSGPPHSSLYFYSGVVPTAALQCLSGMWQPFYLYRLVFVILDQPCCCFISQYLELRFSKPVRICGTLTFIFQMVGDNET